MKQAYNQQEKDIILNRYLCDETDMEIYKNTEISRTTLYSWIHAYNQSKKSKILNIADYKKLKQHCEKLENIIKILKTAGCTINAPLKTKYEVIKNMPTLSAIMFWTLIVRIKKIFLFAFHLSIF